MKIFKTDSDIGPGVLGSKGLTGMLVALSVVSGLGAVVLQQRFFSTDRVALAKRTLCASVPFAALAGGNRALRGREPRPKSEQPALDLTMRHCGRGRRGRAQLLLVEDLLEEISQPAATAEEARLREEVEWPYVVGKLLMNCEPPEGLIVPHPRGQYRVFRSLSSKGAYAALLKPETEGDELLPLVAYRGTRMRWRATGGGWTLVDDLGAHIGAKGLIGLLPALRPLLEDPSLGFVEEGGQHDVVGMSLGGAHAQGHAYLFSALGGRVRRATLICPAGVAQPTIDAFAELDEMPHLVYVTEQDDCTPETGDGHIGLGCPAERAAIDYYMLRVTDGEPEQRFASGSLPERPPVASYLSEAAHQLLWRSLRKSHIRHTFQEPHRVYHVDNSTPEGREQIEAVLSHGRPNILETARRALSHGSPTALVDLIAEGDRDEPVSRRK